MKYEYFVQKNIQSVRSFTILFLLILFFASCKYETESYASATVAGKIIRTKIVNLSKEMNKSNAPLSFVKIKSLELCDLRNMQLPDQDMVGKYWDSIYYNRQVKTSGDETRISFDFISDCCQSFSGERSYLNLLL